MMTYLLQNIWRNDYVSEAVLPQCERFISDPPESRDPECKRFSGHIFTKFLMQLDAVNLQGSQALRQRRKYLVNQAQHMLLTLDEGHEACHVSWSDEGS